MGRSPPRSSGSISRALRPPAHGHLQPLFSHASGTLQARTGGFLRRKEPPKGGSLQRSHAGMWCRTRRLVAASSLVSSPSICWAAFRHRRHEADEGGGRGGGGEGGRDNGEFHGRVAPTTTVPPTTTTTTTVPSSTTTTSTVPETTTTTAAPTLPPMTTTAPPSTATSATPAEAPSPEARQSAPSGTKGDPSQPPFPSPTSVSAARATASTGSDDFSRQSQILRLLEAAGARRHNLERRMAEREALLGAAEAELSAAQARLQAARAAEQRATEVLSSSRAALRAVGDVPPGGPLPAVAAPSSLPNLLVPGLHHLSTSTANDVRVAALFSAVRFAEQQTAVQGRKAALTRQVGSQEHERAAARQRTAAVQQWMSKRTEAVGAAQQAVNEVREQLWSAVRDDPSMRQARALTTAPDGKFVDPTPFAVADIPADYLDLYRAAATTCHGLSWTVLAAIGSIDTSHGGLAAEGVHRGPTSPARWVRCSSSPEHGLPTRWTATATVSATSTHRPTPSSALPSTCVPAERAPSPGWRTRSGPTTTRPGTWTTSSPWRCATASMGCRSAPRRPTFTPSSRTGT